MKAIPEGDGTLLDHTCCAYVNEHAEASPHKCNGQAVLVVGGGIKGSAHTKSQVGDVYLTIADEVLKTPIGKAFPTAEEKMSALVLAATGFCPRKDRPPTAMVCPTPTLTITALDANCQDK
jgi:hypothetical protein